MSWFSHCTRQATVDFVSMYSLGQSNPPYCLYVTAQERPEQGEREKNDTAGRLRELKKWRCKTLVGIGERTKGDGFKRQAPGRAKELG